MKRREKTVKKQMNHPDEIYSRAMNFVENINKTREGVSNIYVFTSVDKDGNIMDEKYGMNLMTNYGFQTIYKSNNNFSASDSVKLYTGTGTGDILITGNSMELPAFGGAAAINSDVNKAYNYPIYYSKGINEGEGLITLISRFLVAYYDYNVTGYPEEIRISEYGIGTSPTKLWTHSHVYDVKGNRSSMLKTPNERLIITVYMCLSLYEHVIMNGWENNRFLVITRNDIMYNRMGFNTVINMFKRNNTLINVTGSPSRTLNDSNSNVYINSTIAPQVILYDGMSTSYDTSTKALNSGYFDGWALSYSGFMLIEPQRLTQPENVLLSNFYSCDPNKYTGFSDCFGKVPSSESNYSKSKYPTFTHLMDAEAYLYDWKRKGWVNKLDILNSNDKYYDDTPIQSACALPIYYFNNGQMLTGYIYQNIYPEDKIKSILSGSTTVYATNKYWANTSVDNNTDPDKGWVWIRDYNNIPENCQSARYWITNTNTDSLTLVREKPVFQLLEKGTGKNGYETFIEFGSRKSIYPQCDNYEYGWYKSNNIVYVPATRKKYTVGSSGINASETMTFGRWIVNFNSDNNKIIVVDMSHAIDQQVVLPVELTLSFTGTVNSLSQTYRTESGTGLICIQSLNSQESIVLDLRGDTVIQVHHTWKRAACIWGSNKIVYINSETGDKNVYIYDVDTEAIDGDPIPFPEGVNDIPCLFGHTKYVWMTNGSSFGYVADISSPTHTIDAFTYSGLYGSGLNTVKFTIVDDVFIIYKSNECGVGGIKKAHYIRLDEPTNAVVMTPFENDITSNLGDRIDFILRYVQDGIDNSGNKTGALFLLVTRGYYNNYSDPNGSDNTMIDFGQYLSTGEVHRWYHRNAYNLGNFVLYGQNLIYEYYKVPLANYMPIKLTGKTDTITSFNNIKSVSNKSWLISYTNNPTWGYEINGKGVPPGVPVAVTNKDGTIVGWT